MFNIFKKKITEKTSVSANGMMFLIDPFNSHFWGMLFSSGSWEPETFDFYKKYTRPDKEIIDIGGWIGPTMLIAYSLNPKKIHMVEADPANFQILKSNCLRNNMQDKVELLHACLTNKTGDIIEFGSTPDRCTSTKHINTPGGIKVLSLDIMEYLKSKDLENVCIIKIDTEGAEAMFAKGLEYISKFPGIAAVNIGRRPNIEQFAGFYLCDFFACFINKNRIIAALI